MNGSTIIYNSATASIMYLKSREYMYIAIEGYPSMEKLKEFYYALLQGITHSNVEKFLFDTSKLSVIKSEDLMWFNNNITPLLVKHKDAKVVFIKPDNVFGMKSVETIFKNMKDIVMVNISPNMEKAEDWLFQQKSVSI